MNDKRIKLLNKKGFSEKGKYILYCMEACQREDYNPALEFAIHLSNNYKKPVLVAFFITDKYRFSNQRYYRFMLEGIIKTKKKIEERGVKFLVQKDKFLEGCLRLGKDAFGIITDKNYLKTQRKWREDLALMSEISVFEVETEVVVPLDYISSKAVPYSYLYRKKLEKLIHSFLRDYEKIEPEFNSTGMDLESIDFEKPEDYLKILNIDKTVPTVEKYYTGGSEEAEKRLKEFIEKKLPYYKDYRSDPSKDYQSNLSPYLHFGQISPAKVVNEILKEYDYEDANIKSFLNEIVVWRELARNFCWHNPNYNQYEGIPKWAKESLEKHVSDKRPYLYTLEELEHGLTHDKYWNAAQKELLETGKMHNYMRMYWAKKLIEWTDHPKTAFDYACYLNDKYELDGRDPNGYAGISWCFGSFDRPWQERKIFGKVRYMSDKGLERKFNIKKYVEKYL